MHSDLVLKLGPDQIIFLVITTQNQLLLFNLHDSDPKLGPDQSVYVALALKEHIGLKDRPAAKMILFTNFFLQLF